MINSLQFNLSVPTPYVFMRRFLKAAESDKKVIYNRNVNKLKNTMLSETILTR